MNNKNETTQAIEELIATGSCRLANLNLTISNQVLSVTIMRDRPRMNPHEVMVQRQQLMISIDGLKNAFPEFKELTDGLAVKYCFYRFFKGGEGQTTNH